MGRSVLAAACVAVLSVMAAGPATARQAPAVAATAKGPGYLGVYGEPVGEAGQGLRVTAVDPGSPADKAGLIAGDTIRFIYVNNMTTLLVRQTQVDSQEMLDAFLARTSPGTRGVYVSGMFRGYKLSGMTLVAPPEGLKPPPSAVAAPSVEAIEATRTTYLAMCGRGAEKLSAATCDGLKRDLDAAVARQAEATRVAEVMASYRALCGPGAAAKLSKETCDGMLAEARGAAPAR